METAELLKNSIITGIEMHALFLLIILLLYHRMCKSFRRNSRGRDLPLHFVYVGSALMVVSDCTWSTVSSLGRSGTVAAYIINLVYFISSSLAAASWFLFCIRHLETPLQKKRAAHIIALVPHTLVTLLYLLSPWFGWIFSVQDGTYVRGPLFVLDPIIKMGYIGLASVLAIVCGSRKGFRYLRKKDWDYVLFGVPVVFCGHLQTITGSDFNCLGVILGLILIYITGITNPDRENTDALYSLGNSFEASYIVNADTGRIRPLHQDIMHDRSVPGMASLDYDTHFQGVLSVILLPEDREETLRGYRLENVTKRFEIDNAFTIRYRTRMPSGQTEIHTAAFIRASGKEGRHEFLLGINTIHSDSLLYERSESLARENKHLEQIDGSIIESVAKIVEARDGGSGAHIVRVRKLTEILARGLMTECPRAHLDEEQVRLISSASMLHDVGKIVIPDAVLLKPGRLTEEEFAIMKTHSAKGCDILNVFPLGLDDAFLECALSICRWHHEKYDGKGYPDGLKGEEIPIAAQIVSLADCFDALVSDRPYKKAFSPEKALAMIANGECGAFSPEMLAVMEKQKAKLTELARLYR